jgi:hypothetical protein
MRIALFIIGWVVGNVAVIGALETGLLHGPGAVWLILVWLLACCAGVESTRQT